MKFCLSSRQSAEYLRKADEIRVEYRDRKNIPDLAEKYPNATVILEIPPQTRWELDEIKQYSYLCKGKFICCLAHINDEGIPFLQEHNIPFFWGYEVTTPNELNLVKQIGVCYVLISGPLFFQQDLLVKKGVPARVMPNLANLYHFPSSFGTTGAWIRPEDLHLYEPAVAAVEFFAPDLKREQALFRIYAEQKAWPGQLHMIVENLGDTPTNRMLPTEITLSRLNCGQKCEANGSCRLCYRYFALANEEKIKEYKAEVIDKNEPVE